VHWFSVVFAKQEAKLSLG